ncbi:heme o synthase [Mucisphaera calidilacus]|uniref:Protoheme IX farnesyltransferase n=1 Tax=Mucisphaera calidilacus TaxID=2527982 RepID=A0A518BV48_9BACT|nr:heme o synthase [Mucisphaera calidilacus]QDU70862.1 Protoheme IX farnesyltransferase [Mucisphaera calidilacus]
MSHAARLDKPVGGETGVAKAVCTSRWCDYVELAKLRITVMVVLTAWVGYVLAVPMAAWDVVTILAMTLGVGFSCVSSGILNQVWERDADARMTRTQNRPVAAGRISVTQGVVLGIATGVLGVGILYLGTTVLAALLALATLLVYVLIYTPMKSLTPWATHVGAIPGAMPPFIGYAAGTGSLSADAWPAFLILLVWQIPHFMAIAWLYRDQYASAGLRMLPSVDRTGRRVSAHVAVTSLLLVGVAAMPLFARFGSAGLLYGVLALGGTVAFAAAGVWFAARPCDGRARVVFITSLLYLPFVYAILAWDRP